MTDTVPLVSADSHVYEPPNLWQERLPAHLRNRAPRIVPDGDWLVLAIEGVPNRKLLRREEGVPVEEQLARFNEVVGGADLDRRVRDMHQDGVVAEVVYPTWGLFVDLIQDPELQMACARAYNDWCAEVFMARPDMFIPSAILPVRDVGAARRELERVAALGFRSALIPTTPPAGTGYNQPIYDELWQVAAAARIPLSLHTGTGAQPQHERGPGGAVINYTKVGLLSAETLAVVCSSGVFDRFPELHLVFVETGAGWLAYCCERMDEAYEEHKAWVRPKLSARPSELARRNCHVTLGADRTPLLTREITGIEPLLWASDYPHPEGTFPESQQVVRRIFADLTEAERRAVTFGNAARLYGIAGR